MFKMENESGTEEKCEPVCVCGGGGGEGGGVSVCWCVDACMCVYVCKCTSSAPPKLVHIFPAQKQRYLLEIAFAKLLSRGNRTRQGFSRFDIINFGPSMTFSASESTSFCASSSAPSSAEACLLRLRRSCASRTALATAHLRCGRVLRMPRVTFDFFDFSAENCRSFIHRLMICGLHDDTQLKTFF